jgi:hypothetical protein
MNCKATDKTLGSGPISFNHLNFSGNIILFQMFYGKKAKNLRSTELQW